MKKLINVGLITLGLALPPGFVTARDNPAPTAASQPSSSTDNQTLKFQLSSKLDERYPNNNIEVTVFNSVVLLTGQVSSKTIKQAVVDSAKQLSGLESVISYVSVGEKQSAAQTAKDSWITTQATTKLLTVSGINSNNIKVVTTKGVVYLLGNVTHSQAAAIVKAIKPINGVRKITVLFNFD